MDFIETKRLRLYPLNEEALRQLSVGRGQLDNYLGLKPSGSERSGRIQKEMRDALRQWKKFVRLHPVEYQWGTNWEVILVHENRSIGGIGLNGFPDENGKVVVGYVIDDRYQQQGYATEALAGLAGWAFKDTRLHSMEALTLFDNLASHGVLLNNGFQRKEVTEIESLKLVAWLLNRESHLQFRSANLSPS